MYKIFKQNEDRWEEIETHNLALEEVILRVLELEKLNPDQVYRLEEVSRLGNKVIEFN